MIDRYRFLRFAIPGTFTAVIATTSYAVIDAGHPATHSPVQAELAIPDAMPALSRPVILPVSLTPKITLQEQETLPPSNHQPQETPSHTETAAHSATVSLASTRPTPDTAPVIKTVVSSSAPEKSLLPTGWQRHTIASGESLSSVFETLNLGYSTLLTILNTNELAKELTRLHPGKTLEYKLNAAGELEHLLYRKNSLENIQVSRNGAAFKVEKQVKKLERELTFAEGTIQSSLFLDAKKAGMNDNLTMQLANIYAWDIDFAQDLRPGDQFSVLYETFLGEDQTLVKTGHIVAAEFTHRGRSHKAVRYENQEDKFKYYSPNGKPLRTRFLRTPVEYARISSHFNLKRRHPVLNRIRAHKGVDYAAATGTPIHSTAKGKIVFRGRKGGYGNVVIVRHDSKYSTLYAHMSRFAKKQKVGTWIDQGDLIGYVGSTGLASGPHLHYEFHVNGRHRNPLTVPLPQSTPIRRALLADFKAQTGPLMSQLERFSSIAVAQANTGR